MTSIHYLSGKSDRVGRLSHSILVAESLVKEWAKGFVKKPGRAG